VKITRQNFIKNLVLITGLTRSGKTMLAPIVASLERAEPLTMNYLMEQIPMSHILGLIPDDTAVCLMRYAIDTMFYDLMIGRNLNFRWGDLTSAWKSTRPIDCIKRLFAKEGDGVMKTIEGRNSFFLLMVHDALWHADLYFKSFPTAKMIHITRHPVHMVFDWYLKGYGADFFENPRNATLTVNCRSKQLPYYAAGWEEEFLNLPEIDRIIQMVKRLEDSHRRQYDALPEEIRRQVLIIPFERMLTEPHNHLDAICGFLGTSITKKTERICRREKCPRQLNKQDLTREMEQIKNMASESGMDSLISMMREYEDRYQTQKIYS